MMRDTDIGAQRHCRARRTRKWTLPDVKQRLYEDRGEGDFRLVASGDWPANETRFDVAHDRDWLYVTVMTCDACNLGLQTEGLRRASETVEVLLDPYGDGIGYLQFGVGSDGACYENSHWPYRDAATHRHRDPRWTVEIEEELQPPDMVRFYAFRFEYAVVKAAPRIGFNVGRSQSRIGENSAWNHVDGIGFPDAGSFGRLRFGNAGPATAAEPAPRKATGSRPLQFQGTYDWPDNFGNVAYSPADLGREMQWYRDRGLERFYWLDYDAEVWMTGTGRRADRRVDNISRSYHLFGGDFLQGACRAAHKAGAEFVTVFKPFDLGQTADEPFVRDHPECAIRRNPAWMGTEGEPVAVLRLYQCDDAPFPFKLEDIRLWQSRDNKTYRPVRKRFTVKQSLRQRADAVWSAQGLPTVSDAARRRVRCLTVRGLSLDAPYLAVTCKTCDPAGMLRNREYMLAEMVDAAGNPVPHLLRAGPEIPGQGFDFGPRGHNAPSWSRADTGPDRLLRIAGATCALGLCRRRSKYLPGFLEPSFPEVRDFWLAKLRRGMEAGADGISLRIAHHVGCDDWLAYMFAEPVLDTFRARTGRDPMPCNEDYTLIRILRGEAYTQFVREASAMARKAGRLFIHHVENRMLVPPEFDTYCQIHWDWQTWVRERLVDEIDLKYIGPDHAACRQEILPLARKHGVKVNSITPDPEPRGKPRTIHEAPLLVDRAAAGGLDGINLYELWLYRRMTDRGTPLSRGCGEAVIREMKKRSPTKGEVA